MPDYRRDLSGRLTALFLGHSLVDRAAQVVCCCEHCLNNFVGAFIMRILVAILSGIGLVAWSILLVVGIGLSGWGDGAPGRGWSRADMYIFIPLPYFLFTFLSCFPFIKGATLRIGGVLAHILLAVFIVGGLLEVSLTGVVFGFAALVFARLWFAMYSSRRDGKPPNPTPTREDADGRG